MVVSPDRLHQEAIGNQAASVRAGQKKFGIITTGWLILPAHLMQHVTKRSRSRGVTVNLFASSEQQLLDLTDVPSDKFYIISTASGLAGRHRQGGTSKDVLWLGLMCWL